jgi:hypothetical protein
LRSGLQKWRVRQLPSCILLADYIGTGLCSVSVFSFGFVERGHILDEADDVMA